MEYLRGKWIQEVQDAEKDVHYAPWWTAVHAAFKHTLSCLFHLSLWQTSHSCRLSRSPVIQTDGQVTAELHEHGGLSLNEAGSAHLFLHSRSTADGTHLEINDSRGPTGPAGELWDICQHTCHTPDCLTEHTQPQQRGHTQLWISIPACLNRAQKTTPVCLTTNLDIIFDHFWMHMWYSFKMITLYFRYCSRCSLVSIHLHTIKKSIFCFFVGWLVGVIYILILILF